MESLPLPFLSGTPTHPRTDVRLKREGRHLLNLPNAKPPFAGWCVLNCGDTENADCFYTPSIGSNIFSITRLGGFRVGPRLVQGKFGGGCALVE